MTELFLKAKHWQIFALIFLLPLFIELFAIPMFKANEAIKDYHLIMAIRMFLLLGGSFGWFWSISIRLHKNLKDELNIKTGTFKTFFFITFIYFVFVFGLFGLGSGFYFGTNISEGQVSSGGFMGGVIGLVAPLLFPIYCIFYFFKFSAKTIKTVEKNRKIKISEYISYFFGIWFLPIGIWFIQPKVNKIYDSQ